MMGDAISARGFRVCLLADCISFALAFAAAPSVAASCLSLAQHADVYQLAQTGSHSDGHRHAGVSGCCQTCIGILPSPAAVDVTWTVPHPEVVPARVLDGVQDSPILGPPRRFL